MACLRRSVEGARFDMAVRLPAMAKSHAEAPAEPRSKDRWFKSSRPDQISNRGDPERVEGLPRPHGR